MKNVRQMKKSNKNKEENEWEDVDEHEKEAFDKDGYFEVPNEHEHINENDEKLL